MDEDVLGTGRRPGIAPAALWDPVRMVGMSYRERRQGRRLHTGRWAESSASIPRLSRGRRRSGAVANRQPPGLTCRNVSSQGAKGGLGSTANAEADGSIPSSPTKIPGQGPFLEPVSAST